MKMALYIGMSTSLKHLDRKMRRPCRCMEHSIQKEMSGEFCIKSEENNLDSRSRCVTDEE